MQKPREPQRANINILKDKDVYEKKMQAKQTSTTSTSQAVIQVEKHPEPLKKCTKKGQK